MDCDWKIRRPVLFQVAFLSIGESMATLNTTKIFAVTIAGFVYVPVTPGTAFEPVHNLTPSVIYTGYNALTELPLEQAVC